MGLRTASARRPHVMVMAPALTKPTQSPKFKLLPGSSAGSSTTSALNPPTDEHDIFQSLETDSYEKKLSFDQVNQINAADNLNTLAFVSELIKNNKSTVTAFGDSLSNTVDPNSNMNSTSQHMGDHNDKMGLQKGGLENVNSFMKDKSVTSDVDQLFNSIDSELPEADIGVGSDIAQNDEELLQVFKSIGSETDRLGESDSVFPLSTNDLPGSFSSLEKELFNDVDVMSMSMEDQLLDGANSLKEAHIKELLTDLQKKQLKLERKLEFSLRRLRKIQSKHMGQHVSEEVAGVFEQVHRSLRKAKENANTQYTPEQVDSGVGTSTYNVQNDVNVIEKLKPISQNSAKNLIRKLELSSNLQATSIGRQRHTPRYFGSGSIESTTLRSTLVGATITPHWSPETKKELQRVTGMLSTQLKLVQEQFDSEATASSSGGESCDELQSYNNPHQQQLSIQKRAAWRYAVNRATIAARWTWLKAQIGDLEYRIRQYGDLYKHIRASKGNVVLGDCVTSSFSNVPNSPNAVNGYRGQLPGASSILQKSLDSNSSEIAVENDCQCARTRPLVNFRKRKLLQTWGLHTISKKAARPSTIRCGCVPPLQCAACTGRTDPTRPRDPPEYLNKSECISLLDTSYHPVFSLPEDCSANIHLEAIMKTPEWQHRSMRPNIKTMKYVPKGTEKSNSSLENQPKKLQQTDHRRKYNRLIKTSTINALTAKIKNKFRGRKSGLHLSRLRRKRHSEKINFSTQCQTSESGNEEQDQLGACSAGVNKLESRSSSPLLSMQTISSFKRNSRVSSYDIDNIVIPYSVAASTRVEKLQYKEIQTPKWRIVDVDFSTKNKNNGTVNEAEVDSDNEDLLDEAVVLRHEKCEHEEKKRFLSYIKYPYGYSRSRAHKRTDSRAESSGCNTPDPLSPHTGENAENTVSPLTSPPATPMAVALEDCASSSSTNVLRRRTTSQSKGKDKEPSKDEIRSSTPENVDVIPPYDRRSFPLTEDIYERMLKLMPENHQLQTNIRAQDCASPSSYLNDRVNSPDSESTESALGDEDPNDPEWMEIENSKDRYRR